jgi:hypothetical protein
LDFESLKWVKLTDSQVIQESPFFTFF